MEWPRRVVALFRMLIWNVGLAGHEVDGAAGVLRVALVFFFGKLDVTRQLDVVILRRVRYFGITRIASLTANSPISTSSIPKTSSSAEARRRRAGMYRPTKSRTPRMIQVPTKEYKPPVTESASWYPSWIQLWLSQPPVMELTPSRWAI